MTELGAAAPWDAERLAAALEGCRFGRPLCVLAETASTNDVAWERARVGAPEGLLVLAEHQSRGRGRGGRLWFSPPGVGVWASFLLRPRFDAARVALLPLAAGLAAARAVEEAGVTVGLKWPNDLLALEAGGRKVGGVLAESRFEEARWTVVVGVGVNVNMLPEAFPPDLAGRATSLAAVAGAPVSRETVLAALARCLGEEYEALERGDAAGMLEGWRRRAVIFGRPVRVRDGGAEVHGIAREVADSGALIVRLESGAELEVRAGQLDVLWVDGGEGGA